MEFREPYYMDHMMSSCQSRHGRFYGRLMTHGRFYDILKKEFYENLSFDVLTLSMDSSETESPESYESINNDN